MIKGEITKERMERWKIQTTGAPGLQKVAAPSESDCEQMYLFRLNLCAGESFVLVPEELGNGTRLELVGVLISGRARVSCEHFDEQAARLDGFYLSGGEAAGIHAETACVFYLGGAVDEGYGQPYFRRFDAALPVGAIHQIHGQGAGRREVFMVCGPEAEASRIEAGVTWSGDGTWTSWPPHEHAKDLEEAYFYFDMEPPRFGLHLSYMEAGDIEGIVAHTVTDGTVVLAPAGYHPTAASPGSRNHYFWFMAAHSHASRRYDLAVTDPARADIV